MPDFQRYLERIRAQVRTITCSELASRLCDDPPPLLVDVRERNEHAGGCIPGAVWIPRSYLEQRIGAVALASSREIVVYCAGNTRAPLAASTLGALGYEAVFTLEQGFDGWRQRGNAVAIPAILREDQALRYQRHTMLPEVGVTGQRALLAARVLCVGAGGLGSPSAIYLAAAGVGTLGIVDDDRVEASNLQRQILHTSDRLGEAKVDSAEKTLRAINPDVAIVRHPVRLRSDNALAIFAEYDLIVDGTDNFPTRYLTNDAALRLGLPVVHASIYRFEGQVTVFGARGRPCYRCHFPSPPPPDQAPSCEDAGVLGVLPGLLGVIQATEAIKWIIGIGTPLTGRLLVYDALALSFREFKLRADAACPTCGPAIDRSRIPLIDYERFCAGKD